ncbi:NADAR family protein [Burkholderia pyrrocinia]|uniref:NADAR family protein n=1 Tax=Burkholderia pyrrocinia TaxID=60550 RepID=UPI0015754776|nr:NADAR family protein [Burkholderia pyrrocinia]NTX29776.1 NADAR family protein [Burkholderia pyrrocinia]
MKTTNTMVLFWRTAEIYSNWHPAAFADAGIKFSNSEQYMMWRKAALFGDQQSAAAMLSVSDPKKLKDMGRAVKGYQEEVWERERVDVMIRGCYLKFSQNPAMRDELLATGDRLLVEASPYDTIWGIGLDEGDPRALDQGQWRGRNLLGHALMQVRQMLRNEIEKPATA